MTKLPKILTLVPVVHAFVLRPWPILVSLAVLTAGLVMNDLGGAHVNTVNVSGPPIYDMLHAALPPIDMNVVVSLAHWVVVYLCVFYYLFIQWEDLAPTLLIFGIFFIIRGIFLFVNVLPEPFPRIDDTPLIPVPGVYYGTKDLFPSGHSGSVLILALMVIKWKWFKVLITAAALLIGSSVILMHVHYTFDVLGAFIIAYACYAWVQRHGFTWFRGRLPAADPATTQGPGTAA